MEINKDNYKDWLLRYLDNDLTVTEKAETDLFIKENEWAAQEWNLLNRTRLKPNMEIRFPDKRLLFRTEEPVVELIKPAPVFKMYRYAALAAAAALLAFAIIFSIRKPDNRIETAHSDIRNEMKTNEEQPKNPQAALVAPKAEKELVPTHAQPNMAEPKHTARKNSLMASEKQPVVKKQMQQSVPEQPAQVPDIHPVQNNNYATNKLPVAKTADNQPIKQIQETVEAPAKQVAVVKKSEPSIPSKYASSGYSEDKTLLQSLIDLMHKVSIKKHVADQQTYYALSIETSDIKVNKTIR